MIRLFLSDNPGLPKGLRKDMYTVSEIQKFLRALPVDEDFVPPPPFSVSAGEMESLEEEMWASMGIDPASMRSAPTAPVQVEQTPPPPPAAVDEKTKILTETAAEISISFVSSHLHFVTKHPAHANNEITALILCSVFYDPLQTL
jgi:hypothetical protein